MKLLALIALAVVGLVIVRRNRPDLAQRLEGAAKEAAGSLNGDHGLQAQGKAKNLAGKLRGKAKDAIAGDQSCLWGATRGAAPPQASVVSGASRRTRTPRC